MTSRCPLLNSEGTHLPGAWPEPGCQHERQQAYRQTLRSIARLPTVVRVRSTGRERMRADSSRERFKTSQAIEGVPEE